MVSPVVASSETPVLSSFVDGVGIIVDMDGKFEFDFDVDDVDVVTVVGVDIDVDVKVDGGICVDVEGGISVEGDVDFGTENWELLSTSIKALDISSSSALY